MSDIGLYKCNIGQRVANCMRKENDPKTTHFFLVLQFRFPYFPIKLIIIF